MKFVIAIVVLLISTSNSVTLGKVFPTKFSMKFPQDTYPLVVKDISKVKEFAELVHEEDETRRNLELREGVSNAKAKYSPRFTFRCMCGTTYASVFGTK
jgi:hypothetical protein